MYGDKMIMIVTGAAPAESFSGAAHYIKDTGR